MGNLVSSDRRGVQRLVYARPAEAWLEALPLGNGRIVATCFGAVQAVRNALSAGDVRRAHELARGFQSGYSQAYLPLGDLLLEITILGATPAPPGDMTRYRRVLDLDAPIATAAYDGRVHVRLTTGLGHRVSSA
jgi:alpha-L-fucosidase 2